MRLSAVTPLKDRMRPLCKHKPPRLPNRTERKSMEENEKMKFHEEYDRCIGLFDNKSIEMTYSIMDFFFLFVLSRQ